MYIIKINKNMISLLFLNITMYVRRKGDQRKSQPLLTIGIIVNILMKSIKFK
jgi:hypothetical protein